MENILFCRDCGDEVIPDINNCIKCYYCHGVLVELCAEIDWYRANHGDCPKEVYERGGQVKVSWEN